MTKKYEDDPSLPYEQRLQELTSHHIKETTDLLNKLRVLRSWSVDALSLILDQSDDGGFNSQAAALFCQAPSNVRKKVLERRFLPSEIVLELGREVVLKLGKEDDANL